MTTYTRANLSIAEIIRLSDKKQLILQPKFQRRRAWDEKARSYLIDTIVRGLPMPKIFLRKIVNPETKLAAYEVVDGQQRLNAIIDFRKGNLVLSNKHNPDLGNNIFSSLPDPAQRVFLEYEISAELIEGASDPEIWALFERLNTYTLTLNRQEKLNAKYFGLFKQTAYQLASEESALNAWKQLTVFSDRQIARMKEVEMTSDIMVAVIKGISDMADIKDLYKKYDDQFPMKEYIMRSFRITLSLVTDQLLVEVKVTRFRRLAWFYSLMVAVADVMLGIPKGTGPQSIQSGEQLRKRMLDIDKALKQEEIPEGLKALHNTLSRSTSHIKERKIRHDYFFKMLTMAEDEWRNYWNNLTTQ